MNRLSILFIFLLDLTLMQHPFSCRDILIYIFITLQLLKRVQTKRNIVSD